MKQEAVLCISVLSHCGVGLKPADSLTHIWCYRPP